MSTTTLLTWTVVALLGVMTPGIDPIPVLRHTLLDGRRAGMRAVSGIALGCLAWATAGLAGLTASRLAQDMVRIAGAAYLIWLVAIHLAVSLLWYPVVVRSAAKARTVSRSGYGAGWTRSPQPSSSDSASHWPRKPADDAAAQP